MPVWFALVLAGMLGMGAGAVAQHYNDEHPSAGGVPQQQQVIEHQN